MGCFLSCLACEAASCACRGLCSCCSKVTPSSLIGGRVFYTVIFFVFSLLAWIFRNWGDDILHKLHIPELKFCEDNECFGVMAIYRVSLALFVFHLLQAIIMIGVKKIGDCRVSIQDGWWGFKILLLIGGIIGSFFIPNVFFEYYGWIALVASGFFIVFQLALLVDFAHSWAENWIGKYEESDGNGWWYALLSATGVLFLISLILTICMYIFFCKDAAECQMNVAFSTLNIIFAILISAVSIHPKVQDANPRSGLLQSSLIVAYTTYLVWSAMMSETNETCNPFQSMTGGASQVSLLIGAIFTIIAVCYSTLGTVHRMKFDSGETEPLNREETGEGDNEEDKMNKEIESDEPVPYNFSFFHFFFALASLYIAMLMSDWYTVNKNGDSVRVDSGIGAVWVKIISSWAGLLLYAWTLVGPILLPDRDWGVTPETPW